jgi:endonuclease-8
MPEGDALHRAAARLQVLVGERIEAESPHPRARVSGVAEAVNGKVLRQVEAVGKNLLLHFDDGVTVRSHLRMNGRWRVERRGSPRTGRPWLVLRGGAWEAVQWNGPVLSLDAAPVRRLGPDLLGEIDIPAVARRVRRVHVGRPLGEALLDQRLVSGIGNMWMAELLWQARLSPWLPSGEAPEAALEDALAWARKAMRGSVAGRRPSRAVYRRAGRPCPRCGEPVRSRGLGDANRTAYWCAGCQPGPEPPPVPPTRR